MNGSLFEKSASVLPKGFLFSQSSLQDYCECRRRFQLRYLLKLRWPAVESEPAIENEHFIQQGISFHHLAHQLFVGVPADLLSDSANNFDLSLWFQNLILYKKNTILSQKESLYPENILSAELGGHRLIAKFDLVTRGVDGDFTIFDWKTSGRLPEKKRLSDRIQTRLYPFLLSQAGSVLNDGQKIKPESIEMTYWYASFPDQAISFRYSQEKMEDDRSYFTSLVREISELNSEEYVMTTQEKRCAYCFYRSFCERGDRAGDLMQADEATELGEAPEIQIDFDLIPEISY